MTTAATFLRPSETNVSIPTKLKRTKDIALFLFRYGGRGLIDHYGLGHFLPERTETLTQTASRLRDDLITLGPTFIKLGQLLSTRADILPPEVLSELSQLQDKVDPLPFSTVRDVVQTELGGRLETLFDEFDPDPVGSASLGQVHFAVLRSGHRVAVKVQRPNIEPVIALDMAVLRDFAKWFDQKTTSGKRYRFSDLHAEFERTIFQELDYEFEAQNLTRLKDNLSQFDNIIIPTPIPDYSTKRVLTMDYVGGKKVTNLSPLGRMEVEGEKIVVSLLRAYLKQVFVDGFFHADPHPGNVFLLDHDHVALIDLGMVGTLSPLLRHRLLQLLPCIYQQDPDGVVETALAISEVDDHSNRAGLTRAVAGLLQKSRVSSLDRLGISEVLFGIVRVSAEAGVHLPPEISLLGRTLMHLDRIGRVLAPDFNVNQAIEHEMDSIMRQQVMKDASPRLWIRGLMELKDFLERLPARADRLIESVLNRKFGFRVDLVPEVHLLENLEKIANRITVGLILASLIIGASQLMQVQTHFTLFGYPGFAMICFLLALLGALILVFSILRGDRRTHDESASK